MTGYCAHHEQSLQQQGPECNPSAQERRRLQRYSEGASDMLAGLGSIRDAQHCARLCFIRHAMWTCLILGHERRHRWQGGDCDPCAQEHCRLQRYSEMLATYWRGLEIIRTYADHLHLVDYEWVVSVAPSIASERHCMYDWVLCAPRAEL